MMRQMTAHSLLQEYALQDNPSDRRALESTIATNRDQVQRQMDDYEATIVSDVDKRNYAAVKELANQFRQAETAVLDASRAALSKGETPNEGPAINLSASTAETPAALASTVSDRLGALARAHALRCSPRLASLFRARRAYMR